MMIYTRPPAMAGKGRTCRNTATPCKWTCTAWPFTTSKAVVQWSNCFLMRRDLIVASHDCDGSCAGCYSTSTLCTCSHSVHTIRDILLTTRNFLPDRASIRSPMSTSYNFPSGVPQESFLPTSSYDYQTLSESSGPQQLARSHDGDIEGTEERPQRRQRVDGPVEDGPQHAYDTAAMSADGVSVAPGRAAPASDPAAAGLLPLHINTRPPPAFFLCLSDYRTGPPVPVFLGGKFCPYAFLFPDGFPGRTRLVVVDSLVAERMCAAEGRAVFRPRAVVARTQRGELKVVRLFSYAAGGFVRLYPNNDVDVAALPPPWNVDISTDHFPSLQLLRVAVSTQIVPFVRMALQSRPQDAAADADKNSGEDNVQELPDLTNPSLLG
ncbi:unnamed protein product [Mycena citricolor]|uniref:Uncharacterized protein n=1 Tax=Mycena citricolor TaxID=2018698 RepID=A0AAD2HM09_9AGAR|nr:unnamed protein product [Mycena citricolor]